MNELVAFVPEPLRCEDVELVEKRTDVMSRISQVLPTDIIWKLFASSPTETGGKVTFPYCRVDTGVSFAGIALKLYKQEPNTLHDHISDPLDATDKQYDEATQLMFACLVWIEIGFEGFQNYAYSSASRNWTMFIGHGLSEDDQARGDVLMSAGKLHYEMCVHFFHELRLRVGKLHDVFAQYGLEHLLYKYDK